MDVLGCLVRWFGCVELGVRSFESLVLRVFLRDGAVGLSV